MLNRETIISNCIERVEIPIGSRLWYLPRLPDDSWRIQRCESCELTLPSLDFSVVATTSCSGVFGVQGEGRALGDAVSWLQTCIIAEPY